MIPPPSAGGERCPRHRPGPPTLQVPRQPANGPADVSSITRPWRRGRFAALSREIQARPSATEGLGLGQSSIQLRAVSKRGWLDGYGRRAFNWVRPVAAADRLL